MTQQISHAQWALDLVVEVDEHHRGFAGSFLRQTMSAERRHVIAAYLAALSPGEDPLADVGKFLLSADHRSILIAAHGQAVRGLRGALRRAGPAVHTKQFYHVLHKVLASPPHAAAVKCIARLPSLDVTKLDILKRLPASICCANVVDAIDNADVGKDVAGAFALLAAHGADEDELASAIRQVRDERGLAKVFQTWVRECRAPQHPIPENDSYKAISTAAALHLVARRYRNCARSYTIDLLDDEAGHAFAETNFNGEGVIVHLRKESGRWRLDGAYGRQNKRPSVNVRSQVHAYLEAHGIEIEKPRRSTSTWDAVRRFTEREFMDFNHW